MSIFQLVIIGGVGGFILIALTALGGLKVIKINFKTHRILGIACLAWGFLHGLAALLMYFGVI
jgi:hypothetical protein